MDKGVLEKGIVQVEGHIYMQYFRKRGSRSRQIISEQLQVARLYQPARGPGLTTDTSPLVSRHRGRQPKGTGGLSSYPGLRSDRACSQQSC